jgi:hypothetical protein
MDTSKDVAQATGATDPVIDSKPPAADPVVESKPAAETAAPPTAASAAVAEPELPPAPVPQPSTAGAVAPQAAPAEAPKPIENATTAAARTPPPERKQAPFVVPPAIAQRAAARKERGPSRAGRFGILAAVLALTAGIGGALGAAGFATASKMMAAAPARQPVAAGDDIKAEIKALRDSVTQTRAGVKTLAETVAALKGTLESAGKATGGQFAKVGETIARLSESVERAERTQAEPAARLAKVIETLERLERRAANMAVAPETTGSIAGQQGKPLGQPPQSLQQQLQQSPSQTVPEAKASAPPIVEGWILHRVESGVALIEGRSGFAEVETGDTIRGIGRVQDIKRQDGRWVVVTGRGLIVPAR